ARERHVELVGKVRDRRVGPSEMLEHATPGGVRERGERSIKSARHILNHMVQYLTQPFAVRKGGFIASNDHQRVDFVPLGAGVGQAFSARSANADLALTPVGRYACDVRRESTDVIYG